MAVPGAVRWDACVVAGCQGASVGPGGECLVHMSDETLSVWLSAPDGPTDLDGRGACFDAASLSRVLEAVPLKEGAPWIGAVRFDDATFERQATFDQATFTGPASFAGTTFAGDARFGGATFEQEASFDGASFAGQAWFVGARLGGPSSFRAATFSGPAWFQRAELGASATFDGVAFANNATFTSAVFSAPASFVGASFQGHGRFDKATFSAGCHFEEAKFYLDGEGPPSSGLGAEAFSPPASGPTAEAASRAWRATRRRSRARRSVRLLVAPALIGAVAFIVLRPDGGRTSDGQTAFGSKTSYAFIHKNPETGLPSRFNPCEPIRYVVNPALAPPGWEEALKEAVGDVAEATGVRFEYEGITTESVVPNLRAEAEVSAPASMSVAAYASLYRQLFGRSSFQPDRYGADRWAPVLVQWVEFDPGSEAETVVGLGDSDPRLVDGQSVFVSGTALINAKAGDEVRRSGLMHELGHVVGLAHVDDPFAIMQPEADTGRPVWGAGDLVGLAKVGQGGGCLKSPAPGP